MKKETFSFFSKENLPSATEIAEGRYTWLTSPSIIFLPIRFPFEEGNRKTGTKRKPSLYMLLYLGEDKCALMVKNWEIHRLNSIDYLG